MIFYVVQCKFCGNWRVINTNNLVLYVYSCFKCNTKFKVYSRGNIKVKIYGPMDNHQATTKCQNLNFTKG